MATFVFPTDAISRRSVDSMFEPQWNAAQAAGHHVALLDFDSIEDGLRTVGEFGEQPVILRGWMMTPKVYRRLEVQLQEQGVTLLTSADQYQQCHWLPEWYSSVKSTALTKWFPNVDEAADAMASLGWPAFFVKDFVKTTSIDGPPIVHTRQELRRLVEQMIEYRGQLEGGLCLRQVEQFVPGQERRYFVLNGQIYGPEDGKPIIQEFCPSIDSPFFSVDLGQLQDGSWRVIELGDGQVSDLKEWSPQNFYSMWEP